MFGVPHASNGRNWKLLVPIGVIFGLGYIDFAVYYSLGYEEIYLHHSKGSALTLWIIVGISQLLVFFYWFLVVYAGAGKAPHIEPFDLYARNDNDSSLPEYFISDENGIPFYCSACQSIKIPRTFHLNDLGYCVRKFDHYCIWIGSVVGENNYLYFLKYLTWFNIYFYVIIIYLAIYTRPNVHRGTDDINHNYIVLYILSGVFTLFLVLLIILYFYYTSISKTTLDEISTRQLIKYARWQNAHKGNKRPSGRIPRVEDGKRFINIKHGDNRYVAEYSVSKTVFNVGPKRNWINLVFNGNLSNGELSKPDSFYTNKRLLQSLAVVLIPLVDIYYLFHRPRHAIIDKEKESDFNIMEFYSPQLSNDFLKSLSENIDKGVCKQFYTQQSPLPEPLAKLSSGVEK